VMTGAEANTRSSELGRGWCSVPRLMIEHKVRAQEVGKEGQGRPSRPQRCCLPRFRKDQMLDGAVGREWKSPNRGLLRVGQEEGGDT